MGGLIFNGGRGAIAGNLRYEPKSGQWADLKKRTQRRVTMFFRMDVGGFRDRHAIYGTDPNSG